MLKVHRYGKNHIDVTMDNEQPSPKETILLSTGAVQRLNGDGVSFPLWKKETLRYSPIPSERVPLSIKNFRGI